MAAMPPSQAGWRASRTRSRASKPAVSLSLAPRRWHSEAVAVHTLAATASTMALSISLSLRPAAVHCVVPYVTIAGPQPHRPARRLPRPGWPGRDERAGDGLAAAVFRDQQQPGQVQRDTRAAGDGKDHEGEPDDHYVHAEVAGQARGDSGHHAVLYGPARGSALRPGAERRAGNLERYLARCP